MLYNIEACLLLSSYFVTLAVLQACSVNTVFVWSGWFSEIRRHKGLVIQPLLVECFLRQMPRFVNTKWPSIGVKGQTRHL